MEDTPSDLGPLLWSKLSGSKRSALTLKMCSSLSPSYQKRDKMKLIEKDPTNRRGSLSSWPCFFFPFVVRIRSHSRPKAELFSFSSSASGFTRLNLLLYKAEKKKTYQKKKRKRNSPATQLRDQSRRIWSREDWSE